MAKAMASSVKISGFQMGLWMFNDVYLHIWVYNVYIYMGLYLCNMGLIMSKPDLEQDGIMHGIMQGFLAMSSGFLGKCWEKPNDISIVNPMVNSNQTMIII